MAARLIGGALARVALSAVMPDFVRRGLSARAARRAFNRMGYGMRWGDFLAYRRQVMGIERARPYMASLTRYVRPDPNKLPAWDMGDAPAFRIWGKAVFKHKETGEMHEQWVSIYDHYLRSKDEYTPEFERQFGERFEKYKSILLDVRWIDMVRNTRKQWMIGM